MEAARKDIGVFAAYVFEFPLAPMHKSWLRAITQHDRVLLIGPRGHAKTSIASIAVPCFLIGQNRNIRLKIISCSDDRAKDIAFAIFRVLKNNERFKEVFPDVRLDSKRVSKQKIYIVRDRKYEALKDATVESIGVTSAAEGSRADLVVCFDAETEIFTQEGRWKLFRDLTPDDLVATLDSKGFLEYQKPLEHIEQFYNGLMFSFEGEQVNFVVTPGHNLYVGKPWRPFTAYALVPVEKLYGKRNISFKKDCLWAGKTSLFVEIPSYRHEWVSGNGCRRSVEYPQIKVPSEAFAAFAGFFVAEGNVMFMRGRPCGVKISQRPGNVLDEFRKVLECFPIRHMSTIRADGMVEIRLHSVQLGQFMLQFGHGAVNKKVPIWIRAWDRNHLNIFYNWFKLGDGSAGYVATSSLELADNLEEIALKAGFILRRHVIKPSRVAIGGSDHVYLSKTSYHLSENRHKLRPNVKYRGKRVTGWSKPAYAGMVYCVRVPNKVIFVRRRGAAFWCGNCDDVVSKRNSATPGLRNLVKEMYYNVHVNLLEPGKSKIIYIGTVWDRDDLTVELMQKENSYHKEIFAIDDDFTPLWPQVWTRDRLLERCKEIGLRRFNKGFRNQPSSDQELLFTDQLFEQCTDNSLQLNDLREIALKNIKEGRWKVSIGVDLASGELKKAKFHQRRRRAFNAVFTLAIDENDRRIPISIHRFRARSPETARIILQEYKQFKPEVILIENNAQSALIDWLGELTKMPIQTYFTDTVKHDDEKGVRSLATEFENRMWRLPAWSHEVDCSCEFCAWRREMLSYPFGRFTDTVMACWLSREGVRLHMSSGAGTGKFVLWET